MNQEVSLYMIEKEDEILWHLEKFNVIKTLSGDEKMKLKPLVSMKRFEKGETIYFPSNFKGRVYFLKEGLVKIVRITDMGEEQITDTLGPGELFGGLLFSEDQNRSEMAVALKNVLICYLDAEEWNSFISDNPKFRMSILKIAGLKLKRLEVKIEQIQFLNLKDRIKVVLQELADKHGNELSNGQDIEIKMNLTHSDIAKLAGTSRQSVTTVMRQLQDAKLIDYDQRGIVIKNYDALSA